MSKLVRSLGATVAVLLSVLTFVPGVAEAGVGNQATPDIPSMLTVGDTNIPVSIQIGNTNFGGELGLTNTVCNWGDLAPCPASTPGALVGDPGINAILSCGLLGADQICEPGGADPGVFTFSATGTGAVGTQCAGRTFDIAQTETTFGTLRFTPQPLPPPAAPSPNITIDQSTTCRIDFTVNVVKMPTIDQSTGPSGAAGVQTVFIADNTQWTTGEAGDLANSARGTDNATISKKTPTLTTTASAAGVVGATTLTDTANVFGRINPGATGTVSFRLYGPDDATCTGTPIFEDLDNAYPSTGGPLASDGFTPTLAGTYRWIAGYSGDTNNAAVSGLCNDANESTVVTKASPAITTTASTDVKLGETSLIDSATVTGGVNPVAGATVSFALYGPDDATCLTVPVSTSTVSYPVTGGAVSSNSYTPTVPGTYRWVATYSGDANNNTAVGLCGDIAERTVVSKAAPAIVTAASAAEIAIGGELSDSATVTGRVSPAASTIDFSLYGPDDDDCSGTPVFTSFGVAYSATATTVTSGAFTPTLPGTYRWVAAYNGDANNETATGTCGDPAETVQVFGGLSRIVTNASASTFLGDGTTLSDVATVLDRVTPDDTGIVDFRLYGPNDTACAGTPIFETLDVAYPASGGSVSSGQFTPTQAGIYRWIATYRGDGNNSSAEGACGEAAETVTVAPTPDLDTELPATGPGGVDGTLGIGFASLLAGLALLGISNRRRNIV